MLPDDPNQKPGDPEETSPDLPAPDFSTQRIEPENLEPPAEPEKHDYATRKLETEPPDESAATRRIDPEQLFSALEPELPLPAPPPEPTRIIDEPEGNRGVPAFSLPDEPTRIEPPPTPEAPRPGGFTLPPTPEAPAAGGAPPAAKKNNTWIWAAGIAAVVVLVICCLCIFAFIAMSVIMSNSGTTF